MSVNFSYLLPEIATYIDSHMSKLHPVLLELHEKVQEFPKGHIQTSTSQAVLLQILVKTSRASTILELGTLAGFSALTMALAMPDNGKVVSCDISDEYIHIGKPYWIKAGVADKINICLGDADETLDGMLKGQQLFDLCYIDANKSRYPQYFEKCYQLMRPGGLMLMDNTLFKGEVAKQTSQTSKMIDNIKLCNKRAATDPRVQALILPIGDGMSVIYKE